MGFLIHWLVVAIALWLTAMLVPGVTITSWVTLALAALVLGFVNAIVRPILVILTLPITVLTLGLFYLVVNGIAFGLAAALVPGFQLASVTVRHSRGARHKRDLLVYWYLCQKGLN